MSGNATERRLALLVDTGTALTDPFATDALANAVADALCRHLADWAAVHLVASEDGPAACAGTAYRGQVQPAWLETLRALDPGADLQQVQQMLDGVGLRSYLAVPLMARGRTLGLLSLGRDEDEPFDPADAALVKEIAGRTALAVDNALLFLEIRQAEHRYRDLVQTLDAVVWEFDPETMRFTFISQKAETTLGYPVGRFLSEAGFLERVVHPQDYDNLISTVRDAMERTTDVELEYRLIAADGRTVWMHNHVYVVEDEQQDRKIRGLAVDITKRKLAEGRRGAEHAAARALADADDLQHAAPEILQGICDALGWDTGVLWVVDPSSEMLRCEYVWGRDGRFPRFEAESRRYRLPKEEGLPGRVWATAAPEWIPDVPEDPSFVRGSVAQDEGLRSAFGVPVIGRRRVLGVLEFFSSDVQEPDEDLLGSLMTIGAQVGQFIRRKQTESALRENEEWLSFLAEANTLLATSLRFSLTLERLAQMSVPYLADWCVIDIVEPDGSVRRVSAVDEGALPQVTADEAPHLHVPDPQAAAHAMRLRRASEPLLYRDVDERTIGELARDEEHARLLEKAGIRSLMWVPLVARGRPLGIITFATAGSGRRYDERDLRRVEDLARRAALAVDNARLYEDRERVARTLQKSLLPPHLPQIPGLQVAARYVPAGEGVEVGGDFYDLFQTGQRSWGIALGDVCGKGAEAAALTALTRYALRTAAMQSSKPSEILATLNEAIYRHGSDDRFCSVVYTRLDPIKDGVRATLCCGGHPLPYFIPATGDTQKIARAGTILGVFPEAELSDHVVDLRQGDTLVFYTDGVPEARIDGNVFGEERFAEILAGNRSDAETIADQVTDTVVEFQGGRPSDDIAVLVVQVPPSDHPDESSN